MRVRGASNWVLGRFATLAVINACSRSQIASWRSPGAERGNDAPSRISSYDRFTGISKAAIGGDGKRCFSSKQSLQTGSRMTKFPALLKNLWQ